MVRTAEARVATTSWAAQARQQPTSRWLRLPPVALAAGLTLLALGGQAAWLGWTVPSAPAAAFGGLLALGALAWVTWAWVTLQRPRWVVSPQPSQHVRQRAQVLVDEGPFGHTRNPMALGTAAFMVGLGLAVSATLLVLAAVVLLLILNRHHIPHEEAQLQHAYGGWYSDYAATVRRWL
jgi:protein-S-isoprenylcysteine O-methyltransferase Ste14